MGKRAWTILTGTLVAIALVLMALTAFAGHEALTWDGRVGSLSSALDAAYGDTRDARLSRTTEDGPYDPPMLDSGSLDDARWLAVEYAVPLGRLYGCGGVDSPSVCGGLSKAASCATLLPRLASSARSPDWDWVQRTAEEEIVERIVAADVASCRDAAWLTAVERVAHDTSWIWRVGVAIFGVLAAAVTLGAIGAWRVRPKIIAREAARAAEHRAREDARQAAIVAEGMRQAAASSTGVAGQPGTRTLVLSDEEYAKLKAMLDRKPQERPAAEPAAVGAEGAVTRAEPSGTTSRSISLTPSASPTEPSSPSETPQVESAPSSSSMPTIGLHEGWSSAKQMPPSTEDDAERTAREERLRALLADLSQHRA
jgi:hypothetical protein